MQKVDHVLLGTSSVLKRLTLSHIWVITQWASCLWTTYCWVGTHYCHSLTKRKKYLQQMLISFSLSLN